MACLDTGTMYGFADLDEDGRAKCGACGRWIKIGKTGLMSTHFPPASLPEQRARTTKEQP